MRKELQQLKQEYEAKIRELESRLAVLEKQQAATREAASTAQEKAGQATQVAIQAIETMQKTRPGSQRPIGTTPTYDQLRDAESRLKKLETDSKAFEFHGYLRTGYGLNGKGGQQVAFKAPGAAAKYRLGNEPETYGEFIFVNNWLNPNHDSDQIWLKTEVMIEGDTANSVNFDHNDKFRLPEAFIQGGNLIKSQPALKFWVGNRYYRREDIHINDFYFLNMSGYGAGVEDLDVKVGRMAIAYLAGARPEIMTDNGSLSKNNLDVRLYNVRAPGGSFRFWYNFATTKGGTAPDGTIIPTTSGHAFAFGHFYNEFLRGAGYNRFTVQYGRGAASNFSTLVDLPTPYLKDSRTFRMIEHLVIQPNEKFSIMPAFVYQKSRSGRAQDRTDTWISLGVRPVFFFSEHFSLAIEPGFDYTKSGAGLYRGWLRKFTIAPQIGAGREFFSRPVFRAFFTYAGWSDGFKGLVGGLPYRDRTTGITFGVQVESWW
ncbi:MAG TPA: carbohydrate porin [Blastocatellia bacterium]|nr:carbohydrate porin [Blastocatellia bacterium]